VGTHGQPKRSHSPARDAFLQRFEDEVDPDRKFPPDERACRANHALRVHMLRLRKRAMLSDEVT